MIKGLLFLLFISIVSSCSWIQEYNALVEKNMDIIKNQSHRSARIRSTTRKAIILEREFLEFVKGTLFSFYYEI
ncbi:MAG: hypothetical protein KTV77_04710 [Wolbachia endosymbiont of Fragariocoptes setiger]|nr:hypothetical protein [Wolbachia endosymbiont of Fragariocoptes setiger]